MKKKGVELSMNVIIIAAIGLLVLVILAVLVVNSLKDVNDAKKACNLKSGTCQTSCEDNTPITDGICDEGLVCCRIVSG
jgi:hypothetical protein